MPYADLARVNGINDPSRLEVGARITIPDATRELPVNVITPETRARRPARTAGPAEGAHSVPVADQRRRDAPASGPVATRITTASTSVQRRRPPVRAARDGGCSTATRCAATVNLVIVEHDRGYATVYAHNQDNLVQTGAVVRAGPGDRLLSARAGRPTAPNLHFELRKDNVARNPLFFLPPQGRVTAARAATSVVERTP